MRARLLTFIVFPSFVLAESEILISQLIWEYPDVVYAIEALNELEASGSWCAQNKCRHRRLGDFLFLDLSGEPSWRTIDSYHYFLGNPENEQRIDAYLDLNGRGGDKGDSYWYPVAGMLFTSDQLPGILPAPLKNLRFPGDEDPFEFNGRTYQLRFDKRCHESELRGERRFYSNMNIVLMGDGLEQTISTSINTNDPGPSYSTCEEAKAGLPATITFEFSGDLDGDGKLDLVFLNNGGGFSPSVYLSRYAEPGQLVKIFSSNEAC